MITPMTVHVDEFLSNVSVAYDNPQHIDEEVFPIVPVDKQSDLFVKFSKQHFQDDPDTLAPGAQANDIEIDIDGRGFYYADGHGYNLPIPDALRANADPAIELDTEETIKITEKIKLRKERNLKALMTTSNITQNATLSGVNQWSDYQNSDPIALVDAKKEVIQQATGQLPNRLLLPRPVFRTLRNHPKVIERFKYTVTPPLTVAQLAEAFDVEQIVLAESLYKTTNRGQADALGYVWGNDALLYYRPARPGKRTPALGYTFMWILRDENGPAGIDLRATGGGGVIVKRWREEGKDSDFLGIRAYYAQTFIDANCGFLFKDAIA